jgi:hypothetical protein
VIQQEVERVNGCAAPNKPGRHLLRLGTLRKVTTRPTSGYQTRAHVLLRVAQDTVKEGKGRGTAITTPGPEGMIAERRSGNAGRIGPWLCRMLHLDFRELYF